MAELNESSPPTFQQRVREALERYRALPGNKKLLLFGGMAAVASILVAAYLYTREPAYKVLFSNLPDREGGQVTEALTKLNVPYQLADGGVIRVPAEQVYSTRLKLASEGLPKASGIGFELMDNQKFGISQLLNRSITSVPSRVSWPVPSRRWGWSSRPACIWPCPSKACLCANSSCRPPQYC